VCACITSLNGWPFQKSLYHRCHPRLDALSQAVAHQSVFNADHGHSARSTSNTKEDLLSIQPEANQPKHEHRTDRFDDRGIRGTEHVRIIRTEMNSLRVACPNGGQLCHEIHDQRVTADDDQRQSTTPRRESPPIERRRSPPGCNTSAQSVDSFMSKPQRSERGRFLSKWRRPDRDPAQCAKRVEIRARFASPEHARSLTRRSCPRKRGAWHPARHHRLHHRMFSGRACSACFRAESTGGTSLRHEGRGAILSTSRRNLAQRRGDAEGSRGNG